jgi:predicted dehydrogenase
MSKIYTFGIVGCGKIANKHLAALEKCPQARLAAVCDVLEERACLIGQARRIPHYTDIDRMLKNHPEIDVVCVLTPTGLHSAHCQQVAAHGRHVVVEKPMAMTLIDAEAMIRSCDQAGVRLFVVKQNRHNVPVVKLREFTDQGALGKLTMGTVRLRWRRDQAYYDQAAWRGTWLMDGGVLANQAAHHIDLLQWFMGDVEKVYCQIATQLVDVEVETTAFAVLTFTNGALGIIEATTAVRPKDLEGSLSILGESGSVVIGGFAANKVDIWDFVGRNDNEELKNLLNQPTADGFNHGHVKFFEHLCDCLDNNKPALVDGWEGYKSLRLIHAMYESAATGQEVHLMFRPRYSRLGIG